MNEETQNNDGSRMPYNDAQHGDTQPSNTQHNQSLLTSPVLVTMLKRFYG
jgi:hypothetical protein